MKYEIKTTKIYKDRKHKIEYKYGKDTESGRSYGYICGPMTRNLWYHILEDYSNYIIAEVPDMGIQEYRNYTKIGKLDKT